MLIPAVDILLWVAMNMPLQYVLPKFMAFMHSLAAPLVRLIQLFNWYAYSATIGNYDATYSYNLGDKVKTFSGVYESTVASNLGNNVYDPNYWVKVLECPVGVLEQARYSANRIVYEYAMNRYLGGIFRQYVGADYVPQSDVYIVTGTPVFTTFVVGINELDSSAVGINSSMNNDVTDVEVYTIQSTYTYTIYIPTALFASLDANPINAEKIVRSFADRINPVGETYTIQTY